jgi:hypothetical protein
MSNANDGVLDVAQCPIAHDTAQMYRFRAAQYPVYAISDANTEVHIFSEHRTVFRYLYPIVLGGYCLSSKDSLSLRPT